MHSRRQFFSQNEAMSQIPEQNQFDKEELL